MKRFRLLPPHGLLIIRAGLHLALGSISLDTDSTGDGLLAFKRTILELLNSDDKYGNGCGVPFEISLDINYPVPFQNLRAEANTSAFELLWFVFLCYLSVDSLLPQSS